jgi:rhamnosyltransferase subunit B
MRHASRFFGACIEACGMIGARGVLVSPFRDHIPRELPPFVQAIDSIPFSRLFARSAAVIHHGGIGTSSLALFAAVPQLIMPMAFDQHDNAARLLRLGVARSLSPLRFRPPALARMLEELLKSRSVAASCRITGDRIRQEKPFEEACHWIEHAAAGAA